MPASSLAPLNSLGNQLHKIDDAIQVFALNTVKHPMSSNAFDSLGEAYEKSGNKDLAIKNYKKAIELNPSNLHARNMLKKLQ